MSSEEQQQEIVVCLVEADDFLWRQLATITNEMGISREGRRIFPILDYHIRGLDERKMYEIFLEFHQVDDTYYTFYMGQWVNYAESKVPSIEANRNSKKIRHVAGVKTGEEWMKFAVNFDHVRISSNPNTTNPACVFLQSMHKYVPVLSIYEVGISKPVIVVRFDYTQFIAVTNYQNPAVKSFKNATNPLSSNKNVTKKRGRKASKQKKSDVVPPRATVIPPFVPPIFPHYFMPTMFMLPAHTIPLVNFPLVNLRNDSDTANNLNT